MDDLGPDVWNPDGIKILGTPMGNDAYVRAASTIRVEEESKLWERMGGVPDVQCARQILLQCAGPHCHHWLRTVPPQQSDPYSASHDSGMWQAVATLLGRMPGNTTQQEMARDIATLPMRLGGLGLRSATRVAPAAFWASWADALPMLSQRLPALTDEIMQSLDSVHDGGCLEQLQAAGLSLDRGGFLQRPEWAQLRAGARPPLIPSDEPGDWQHGCQYHASSPLEHHFRETVILAQSCGPSSFAITCRTMCQRRRLWSSNSERV